MQVSYLALTWYETDNSVVSTVQNNFFLTVRYYNSFAPIAQQAEQVVMLGRLSLSMRLSECASKHVCEWRYSLLCADDGQIVSLRA